MSFPFGLPFEPQAVSRLSSVVIACTQLLAATLSAQGEASSRESVLAPSDCPAPTTGDPTDTAFVQIVAEGSIRTAIEARSGNPSGGSGALGLTYERRNRITIAVQITVASSIDTLRAGFGAFVLSPSVAKTFTTTVGATLPFHHRRFGFHGEIFFAGATWGDSAVRNDAATAIVLGFDPSVYYSVLSGTLGSTRVGVRVLAGGSGRLLMGDIAARSAMRRRFLGNNGKTFGGIQSGLRMSVGGVSGTFKLFYFWGDKVAGLTHGQASAIFAVTAPMFQGVLVPD
jgi:hypothetical protein